MARDALAGSLGPEEVRQTFAEIEHESASAVPPVKRAARRMSQAAGKDDPEELIAASRELATACAEAGH